MKDSNIEILLSSDCDYDKLTAEIHINGKFVGLLNQDEGLKKLVLELPDANSEENAVLRKIDLADFEKGLELAKKKIGF